MNGRKIKLMNTSFNFFLDFLTKFHFVFRLKNFFFLFLSFFDCWVRFSEPKIFQIKNRENKFHRFLLIRLNITIALGLLIFIFYIYNYCLFFFLLFSDFILILNLFLSNKTKYSSFPCFVCFFLLWNWIETGW